MDGSEHLAKRTFFGLFFDWEDEKEVLPEWCQAFEVDQTSVLVKLVFSHQTGFLSMSIHVHAH